MAERKHVYSEYDKNYSVEYRKAKKEQIAIDVNKGEKAMYKAFAASQGETLAAMFRRVMQAEMDKAGWKYEAEGDGE